MGNKGMFLHAKSRANSHTRHGTSKTRTRIARFEYSLQNPKYKPRPCDFDTGAQPIGDSIMKPTERKTTGR